jgi:hypothetical protein
VLELEKIKKLKKDIKGKRVGKWILKNYQMN